MEQGYRKSFKIAPGVRLNVTNEESEANVGEKGLRYRVHSNVQGRTEGVPGTKIFYTGLISNRRGMYNSAYNKLLDITRQLRGQDNLQELERNRLEVEYFEHKLEMIQSIPKEVVKPIDWVEVESIPEPFEMGKTGPLEKIAQENAYHYKPNLFAKLFNKDEKKRENLQNQIKLARENDLRDYQSWKRMINTSQNVLKGNVDSYFDVIHEFAPLEDISGLGSGFEFMIHNSHEMEVNFDVNSDSVVPKEVLSLTKNGDISKEQMPKEQYFQILQDYVFSCTLRIARDMFSLLPLKTICIHALDEQRNTTTGRIEKFIILSVKIDKHSLQSLNFDLLDYSNSIKTFEHHLNFNQTSGFRPVQKVEWTSLNVSS